MEFRISTTTELPELAGKLLSLTGDEKVLLFYGDMGAGKTTLIKSLCRRLGVKDTVSSPTFSIVNEYESPAGPVYHFDFYRLNTPAEALDLGFEDYLYSGNYCLIEWPQKIFGLLPEHAVSITITADTETGRLIEVKKQ